jgi:hypothetical protein
MLPLPAFEMLVTVVLAALLGSTVAAYAALLALLSIGWPRVDGPSADAEPPGRGDA